MTRPVEDGAPGGTRTPDPQLRRLMLYPPELLAPRRGPVRAALFRRASRGGRI